LRSNRIFLCVAVLMIAVLNHLSLCSAGWAKSPAPRFMIMIEEKNLGTYTVDEAEKVITAYLMANGMEVVDAELIKTNVDRDKALQVMNASPRSAAAMGLQFGADVVLIGKAISKGSADQIKDTSFRSYQASVSLKAIRTDTAEILAMENREAAKIHVDDMVGGSLAIREAASPLVRDLLPRMMAKLGRGGAGTPEDSTGHRGRHPGLAGRGAEAASSGKDTGNEGCGPAWLRFRGGHLRRPLPGRFPEPGRGADAGQPGPVPAQGPGGDPKQTGHEAGRDRILRNETMGTRAREPSIKPSFLATQRAEPANMGMRPFILRSWPHFFIKE